MLLDLERRHFVPCWRGQDAERIEYMLKNGKHLEIKANDQAGGRRFTGYRYSRV